jgi:hypothetical protein
VSQAEAIEALIELIPIFEASEFVPAEWPDRGTVEKNGITCHYMPYPDYHPEVERFRDLLHHFTAGILPYDPLPEDPTQDGIPFSVLGASFPVEYFETATIDQIRRYFVLLGRGERFCDGHIDGEFKAGKVLAALRRLAVLLENMK